MTHNQSLSARPASRTIFARLRTEVAERRRASIARFELARDLASYRTPSDVSDLLATVDRHGDSPEAEQVRVILSNNLSGYRRGQRLADVI